GSPPLSSTCVFLGRPRLQAGPGCGVPARRRTLDTVLAGVGSQDYLGKLVGDTAARSSAGFDLPPIWWNTGLSGLALCLFGGDIPEGGVEPLTIVVSFDVGEQVVPGGIPGWVASLVHEFGFDRLEHRFHHGSPSNFPSRL